MRLPPALLLATTLLVASLLAGPAAIAQPIMVPLSAQPRGASPPPPPAPSAMPVSPGRSTAATDQGPASPAQQPTQSGIAAPAPDAAAPGAAKP